MSFKKWLLLFAMAPMLAWGQATSPPAPNANLTGVNPTAGRASLGLTNQIRLTDYDAKACTGNSHDDTAAFTAAINAVSNDLTNNIPTTIQLPAGFCYLNGSTLPTIQGLGITWAGAGIHKTYITYGPNYSGAVFSTSESWFVGRDANAYTGTGSQNAVTSPNQDAIGTAFHDFTILGNPTYTKSVAGIALYDRNDRVLIQNVDAYYIHGPCLTVGTTLNMPQAYLRESVINGFNCWYSGTSAIPSVYIGSWTVNGSDATNELRIHDLAIFSATNVGLQLANPNPYGATRAIVIQGLRVEQSGGDNVEIGGPNDQGQVQGILIDGAELLSNQASGSFGLNIGPANTLFNGDELEYDIAISSLIINSGQNGININSARRVTLGVIDNNASNSALTIGTQAGTGLVLTSVGDHPWSINSQAGAPGWTTEMRSPYAVAGNPGTAGRIFSVAFQGSITSASVTPGTVTLSTDGLTPSNANCALAYGYGNVAALRIMVAAYDTTTHANSVVWEVPVAALTFDWGLGSVVLTQATATTLGSGTGTSATVSAVADTTNGCMDLKFTPPAGNTDVWAVTGRIDVTTTAQY